MLDAHLIGALHLTSGALGEEPSRSGAHSAFQASTVSALLDGAYDGDVTFAELAGRGDFGIGTTNGCNGEMIAIDGEFLRAGIDGRTEKIPAEERTPFAVLTSFEPRHRFELDSPGADFDAICAEVDARIGHPEIVHAIRIDGRFERVHCRSVRKQEPPYQPLAEVLAEQSVFDFDEVEGTLLGFRFPDLGLGIGVPGYHLHFVSAGRDLGGHVLDCRVGGLPLGIGVDDLPDLHVETPPGVEISLERDGPSPAAGLDALEREHRSGT